MQGCRDAGMQGCTAIFCRIDPWNAVDGIGIYSAAFYSLQRLLVGSALKGFYDTSHLHLVAHY